MSSYVVITYVEAFDKNNQKSKLFLIGEKEIVRNIKLTKDRYQIAPP